MIILNGDDDGCPVADCANGFIDDKGTPCPHCWGSGSGRVYAVVRRLVPYRVLAENEYGEVRQYHGHSTFVVLRHQREGVTEGYVGTEDSVERARRRIERLSELFP